MSCFTSFALVDSFQVTCFRFFVFNTFFLQVSGLKYGAKYNYRVFAENAAGISDPSNTIGPLLADDPHGETPAETFHRNIKI